MQLRKEFDPFNVIRTFIKLYLELKRYVCTHVDQILHIYIEP